MKQIYNMLQLYSDNNINYLKLNWAHNVKNILDEIGMTNLWIDQNAKTIDFRTIKQRILTYANKTGMQKVLIQVRLTLIVCLNMILTLKRICHL